MNHGSCSTRGGIWGSGARRSFLPSLRPQLCHRLRFNMSGTHVFSGAHHVGLSDCTINAASTVRETAIRYTHRASWWCRSLQINFNNFSNRGTSDAVIPLMPNPSIRFTGRKEIIAKLKEHFSNSADDQVQKRKYFLLYGMGGIGKTQICLKFIEDMSTQWVSSENHVWALFLTLTFCQFFYCFMAWCIFCWHHHTGA